MKKRISLFGIMLCCLAMALLFIVSCGGGGGGGDEGAAAVSKYAQEDLEGTWNFQLLEAGAEDPGGWSRGTVTIDDAGALTFDDFEDTSGSFAPPESSIVWKINPASGAITESNNKKATTAHYSITSNNNLIAGTAKGSSRLFVFQKIGTSYADDDIKDKTFVFHELSTGDIKEWKHGEGSTDDTGAITISSETDPNETVTPVSDWGTISVSGDGIVTMTGLDSYKGLLSADKKTIVGTYTEESDYKMIIIQITDREDYPVGPLPATRWNAHGLVVGGGSYAPLWIRYLATINSSGTVSFSSVKSNQDGISLVVPKSYPGGTLSDSGKITFEPNPSGFHGQWSDDETFMVATQTPHKMDGHEYHSLTIYTDIR